MFTPTLRCECAQPGATRPDRYNMRIYIYRHSDWTVMVYSYHYEQPAARWLHSGSNVFATVTTLSLSSHCVVTVPGKWLMKYKFSFVLQHCYIWVQIKDVKRGNLSFTPSCCHIWRGICTYRVVRFSSSANNFLPHVMPLSHELMSVYVSRVVNAHYR